MEARIMRYSTKQVIFVTEENNILTDLQYYVVQLFVMPSLLKLVA